MSSFNLELTPIAAELIRHLNLGQLQEIEDAYRESLIAYEGRSVDEAKGIASDAAAQLGRALIKSGRKVVRSKTY